MTQLDRRNTTPSARGAVVRARMMSVAHARAEQFAHPPQRASDNREFRPKSACAQLRARNFNS
jgi:hypothetical protein